MKKNIVFAFTFILGSTVLLYSITNTLSYNPFSLKESRANEIRKLLPQEWGFYSKNPRTADLVYLPIDGNNNIQSPNASLKNIWGISRVGRAQGTEAGMIFKKVVSENKLKKVVSI